MAKRTPTSPLKRGNIDRFLALSDAEKEVVYQSVDREIPLGETRPLTPAQRKRWDAAQARDRVGSALKTVSVRLESALLAEADRYAKAHGLKRTQLVAVGLRLAMARANPAADAG